MKKRCNLLQGMPKYSNWEHLPTHLLVLILQKLWETEQLGSCNKTLQLVCQSWRHAFQEHCAKVDDASVCLHSCTDLSQICELIPELLSLRIKSKDAVTLHPLSACSRLTSLSLINQSRRCLLPEIDLLHLPVGLRSLELDRYKVDSASFEHVKCLHLTSLTLL